MAVSSQSTRREGLDPGDLGRAPFLELSTLKLDDRFVSRCHPTPLLSRWHSARPESRRCHERVSGNRSKSFRLESCFQTGNDLRRKFQSFPEPLAVSHRDRIDVEKCLDRRFSCTHWGYWPEAACRPANGSNHRESDLPTSPHVRGQWSFLENRRRASLHLPFAR